MLKLDTVLKFLPVVGPVVAAAPEFKALFDQIVGTFGEKDQATLKDAYAKARAKSDADHATLQEELRGG